MEGESDMMRRIFSARAASSRAGEQNDNRKTNGRSAATARDNLVIEDFL